MTTVIDNRYVVLDKIGGGNMGEVYRVRDRLSGEIIALKKVNIQIVDPALLATQVEEAQYTMLVALTNEFQTLASLRHPHIISVLDYGFAAPDQPYFTMEYLSCTLPVTHIMDAPEVQKVHYLVQMLQALAYLHRRDVLHRDLKPENVLLCDDRVILLDFGLSVSRNFATGRTGTLAYMAPETLAHGQARVESDLYAVGVIAYQLFSGRLPFDDDNHADKIYQLPDFTRLDCSDGLAVVIEKLLQHDPDDRYERATDVIAALRETVNLSEEASDETIRESFLQAAEFVGRETELHQLLQALHRTQQGACEVWLVGGESGIGKTRLLDELRTQALIKGTRVLVGQAVQESGLPFQLWRDILRRLVLMTSLEDMEATLLKTIIPDLDDLLDRTPSRTISGRQINIRQLAATISDILHRINQPILLLLEDLQWSNRSRDLLRALLPLLRDLPIMVVGSYRSDESPELPDAMRVQKVIHLERLSFDAVARLATSMIGVPAAQPDVLNLLQRETEGNVFFLVEVIRALAEEAGNLEKIGSGDLPQTVMAKGITHLLQRRLDRVPVWGRQLLRQAAVAGRRLDRAIIQALVRQGSLMGHHLDIWLTLCAEAAVLTVRDEQWQFAHDKLREWLLMAMTETEKQMCHRDVALAVESIYGDDLTYTGVLAEHWHQAGDFEQELKYVLQAAEELTFTGSHHQVNFLLERALSQLDETERAASNVHYRRLISARADTEESMANYDAARSDYMQVLNLAPEHSELYVHALLGLSTVNWRQGYYAEATDAAHRALATITGSGDLRREAIVYNNLGIIAHFQGDYETARMYHERSLSLRRAVGDFRGEQISLNALGLATYQTGAYDEAQALFETGLAISRQQNIHSGGATLLTNLGIIAFLKKDYRTALMHHERVMNIGYLQHDGHAISSSLGNLALVSMYMGNLETACILFEEGLQMCRDNNTLRATLDRLCQLTRLYVQMDNMKMAQDLLREAMDLAHTLKSFPAQLHVLLAAAHLAYARGHLEIATGWAGYVNANPVLEVEHRLGADDLLTAVESLLDESTFKSLQTQYLDQPVEHLLDNALPLLTD